MGDKSASSVTKEKESWEPGVLRLRKGKQAVPQSDTSDPPATASEEEESQPPKLQERFKRKHEGKDESNSRSVIIAMRRLFDSFEAQQEKRMDAFQLKLECLQKFPEELSAIRAEIAEGRTEIANFIEACEARMVRFESRLTEVEKKLEEKVPDTRNIVEEAVAELKQQLNERDQELLLNDLEISGVPETASENPVHLIKLLSANLGVELDERDIVNAGRVGLVTRNRVESSQPPRPRNIVVRLARRASRDSIINAARVRRGVTATSLGVPAEPPRRVYVNERLTRPNRQLFGRAREQARRQGWKYVWTRDGKIFARKDDGKQVERLRTEKDLQKIFGLNTV